MTFVAIRHRLLRDPALGFVLLAAGLGLIVIASLLEANALSGQPWREAVIVPEGEPLWEGSVAVAARRLPREQFPGDRVLRELLESYLATAAPRLTDFPSTERFFSIDVPAGDLEPLLASGRLPDPGTREVLAGELARLKAFFELDGERFTVVGRLKRGVGGMAFAYVIPRSEATRGHFSEEAGATAGWLDAKGLPALLALDEAGDERLIGLEVLIDAIPTEPLCTWLTLAGLLLVAAGGALVQVRLFHALSERRCGPLTPVFRAVAERPVLLWAMHGLLYGLFFGMMGFGARYPVLNRRLQELVAQAFAEGDLSYIGAAYLSGNIPLAALTTFMQNFVMATVLLTILPSLAIPFFGVLKNVLSFALVGFVMTPLSTEMASMFVYHSITMTLELEAYVMATFVVCILPLSAFKGMARGGFGQELARGLRVVASGTLLAGIMLAAAALYEATTLILIR